MRCLNLECLHETSKSICVNFDSWVINSLKWIIWLKFDWNTLWQKISEPSIILLSWRFCFLYRSLFKQKIVSTNVFTELNIFIKLNWCKQRLCIGFYFLNWKLKIWSHAISLHTSIKTSSQNLLIKAVLPTLESPTVTTVSSCGLATRPLNLSDISILSLRLENSHRHNY